MTPEPGEVIRMATALLSAQADRCMRAAHSLTRITLRLAATDDPAKVLQALAKYRHAGLPEPELTAEIGAMLEGTKSPEWRAATEKRRGVALHRQTERAGANATAMPNLPPEMVLRVARERADALGAAVDAIERGGDRDGEIRHMLTGYVAGQFSLGAVQHALKSCGIEPGSNVIPLHVRRGRP